MDALHVVAVLPHIWIVPVVAVLLGVGAWLLRRLAERQAVKANEKWARKYPHSSHDDKWHDTGAAIFFMLVAAFAGALTTASIVMAIPFQAKYLVFYHVDGTVQSVTNAFESGSGDITSSPVVRLDTLDRAAVVSDPRVMDLVDKQVTLLCSLEWVPYGMDRLNCSIADIK